VEEVSMSISHKDGIAAASAPFGNYIVMVLALVTFAVQFNYDGNQHYLTSLILEHWSVAALFGHMWLHASILHIVCNLVFLWVFGRDVCLKLGNANYLLAYVLLGILSGMVHMFYDGRPAIGASGAVFGILGMYLVLCFRYFSAAGPWIILAWFLMNLTIGASGYFEAAYFSHVGGFLGGVVLAGVLLWLNVVERSDTDDSLLYLLSP
jgi:membrane associated rhomboid family serine protease